MEDSLLRSFDLEETWTLGSSDEVNAILNSTKRSPIIHADSGLIDTNNNILPIELETIPNIYTLVQVPHYCYRARHITYRYRLLPNIHKIKVLMVSIGLSQEYIDNLEGPMCSVKALYPTNPKYSLSIEEDENPVFYALQQLLSEWDESDYRRIMKIESIPRLGKVFITCWVLLLGDLDQMAEIESKIKKIIEEEFGSEEEFVDGALREEGPEVLRLFKPWQLKALNPEQLKGLDPEQLKGLDPEQLKGLDPEQLKGLDPEQLKGLDSKQLKDLEAEQLQDLPPEVLARALELTKKKNNSGE